jgi:hypothetical protein
MAAATLGERGNTCGGPAKAIVESVVKGKAGVVEPTSHWVDPMIGGGQPSHALLPPSSRPWIDIPLVVKGNNSEKKNKKRTLD